jgi:uncharacterized cupredoxin-like copper-binding protein
MAAYYVLGITFVLFALGLTAVGLTREGFPPTRVGGRGIAAGAALIAVSTFTILVLTTDREHPREEAKIAAAEKAQARQQLAPGGRERGQEAGAKQAQGGIVVVSEAEYSVKLPSGTKLEAGPYAFDVVNKGKIEHDLAVEGGSVREKTPLIKPGDDEKLEVHLTPGKYKLYCTVPGHEQLGMKTELDVR